MIIYLILFFQTNSQSISASFSLTYNQIAILNLQHISSQYLNFQMFIQSIDLKSQNQYPLLQISQLQNFDPSSTFTSSQNSYIASYYQWLSLSFQQITVNSLYLRIIPQLSSNTDRSIIFRVNIIEQNENSLCNSCLNKVSCNLSFCSCLPQFTGSFCEREIITIQLDKFIQLSTFDLLSNEVKIFYLRLPKISIKEKMSLLIEKSITLSQIEVYIRSGEVATKFNSQQSFISKILTNHIQINFQDNSSDIYITIQSIYIRQNGNINLTLYDDKKQAWPYIVIIIASIVTCAFIGGVIYYFCRRSNLETIMVRERANIINAAIDDNNTARTMETFFPSVCYGDLSELGHPSWKVNNTCIICLQEFVQDSRVKMLYCLHFFHKKCLTGWVSRNKSCPYCRVSLQWQDNIMIYNKIKQKISNPKQMKKKEFVAIAIKISQQGKEQELKETDLRMI